VWTPIEQIIDIIKFIGGGLKMRFFIINEPKWEMAHFRPEEHPYKYHPSYPLRHGLLKTGEIDWAFWCKQETWMLDQAVRLLDYSKTGDDAYYGGPGRWKLYWQISDDLKRLLVAGGHHIFKGKPKLEEDGGRGKPAEDDCFAYDPSKSPGYNVYIRQNSLVYPKPFVEWAYRNNYLIPQGLQSLLPKIVNSEKPAPPDYTNVSIKKSAYVKALENVRHDDWKSRRGITAQLLNDLGFTARETYMALAESGKSLDDPNGDPDAIVRRWRKTGRQILENLEELE
jgi:hypothetical protein